MPRFVEAEIRNRLWKWYEVERNAEVSAEVSLETGRIDLVVKTDEGTAGIEVKGPTSTDSPLEIIEQLRQYTNSAALDEVYLASNAVDDYLRVCEQVNDTTEEIGVLVYPLDVSPAGTFRVSINCPTSQIIASGTTATPVCVREPADASASASLSTSNSEDWLHYRLWETYDGIAEGALPNINGNGQTVNIDFLRFDGGTTATEVHATGGDVIGYEAKHRLSGVRSQTADQLSSYWESECLNQLYLAVPEEIAPSVVKWVDEDPPSLPSEVGVVAISDSSIEELVPATRVEPKYDSFGHPDYPYHVGFGNAELPEDEPPQSRLDI